MISPNGSYASKCITISPNGTYSDAFVWITPNGSYADECVTVSGCFPKSELVHTNQDSYTSIGKLRIGDKISTWDTEHKRLQYTAITEIHRYIVMEIIKFNDALCVSSSHPIMVLLDEGNGVIVPRWKAAFDIVVGDCIAGLGGKPIKIISKNRGWYTTGIEVINLSTDGGNPFIVRNCIVRAENAKDSMETISSFVSSELVA